MLFNEKQLKILQEASKVITVEFEMKNEEAMKLIADGLGSELGKRKMNMEAIVNSHRTAQIAFIQDVVRFIQMKVVESQKFPPAKVAKATEKFRAILDEIWVFQ